MRGGYRKLAFKIRSECAGCGACKKKCPWEAILGEKKNKHLIEPTLCRECGTCWYTCPKCAVEDPQGYCREKGSRRDLPKAAINQGACAGCQNCLLNCEQRAIDFVPGLITGHCEVEQSLCRGCGSCLTYCASDCIDLA